MGKRTGLLTGALIMGLLVFGLLGTGTVAAQLGEVCSPNPALAIADSNGDGVVSLGELEELNALAGGNADLEAQISKAAAAGITGIRYTGCTPDAGSGGTGAGAGDTGSGSMDGGTSDGNTSTADTDSGSNTTTSSAVKGADGKAGKASSSVSGSTISQADAAADALVVTRLPAVGSGVAHQYSASAITAGSGMLVASIGGLLALTGGITFRLGRKA